MNVHDLNSSSTPSYQPSVFFFRRELHKSKNRDRAITVALIALDEWEQLRLWSVEYGVLPPGELIEAAAACLREAIRKAGSHSQAILLGLFLCHELEQLKTQVRAVGLVPPKWIVLPEEAEAKGWERGEDEAVNL